MTDNIGQHGHDDQPEQLDDTHRDTDSELRREIDECIDAVTRRPWFVALKSLPGEAGFWVGTEGLIGFDGTHFKGRQEIAPFHQQLFDNKWLKGSRLVGQVKDVRFLSPDVALMHAVGGTVLRGKSKPVPERDSIQTLVATHKEGEWRLATSQNTRLHPMDTSAGPFLIWTLSDLLWKVFRLMKQRIGRRRPGS